MSDNASDSKSESDETPHYHGHRERLRERFRSAGPDALSDYELLEMVLFTAQPRRDVKADRRGVGALSLLRPTLLANNFK